MQMCIKAVLVAMVYCQGDAPAEAAPLNPVARVVQLIQGLKARIAADGKEESVIYDKYACWCEDTSSRKAGNIADAKNLISELTSSVSQLKGRLGSFQAEVQGLNNNIKENQESQNKAEEMRKNEHSHFLGEKAAFEQGIANLAKAIQVLGDATASQGVSHLSKDDPMRPSMMSTDAVLETKMLTVAAGVRSAMSLYAKHNDDMDVKKQDFASVKTFLSSPAAWVQTESSSPHKEEYSTQSGAIQGILKDMHDTFIRDLDSSIEAEATSKSDYDSLMSTKRTDKNLLESSLAKKMLEKGTDSKQLADDSATRSETQKQLALDEKFLDTTKASCKQKAEEWNTRSRLRTEEMSGIQQAVDILSSESAVATFNTADTSFVQVTSAETHPTQTAAFNILKRAASQTGNVRLAMIAAKISSGAAWHFDSVISDIAKMIVTLREEEQGDIEHRDWCESERHASNSANEALQYDKDELTKKINRAQAKQGTLDGEVLATENEKTTLLAAMNTSKNLRNEEHAAFQDAFKADADAIQLVGKAIGALSKYFVENPSFLQDLQDPAEYKASEDTAPEANFASHASHGTENKGVVAILGMIKEDMEKEIKVARDEEASADASYRTLLAESQASVDAMDAKIVNLGEQKAAKGRDIANFQAVFGNKDTTETGTQAYLLKLKANCDWIMDQFTARQTSRKNEIKGLDEAKAALAGMKVEGAGLVAKNSNVAKGPSVDDELKQLEDTEQSFGLSFLQRK